MTINDTIQIITHEQLDFSALVKHLSLHPGFPCSQHIRNHFLAQYGTYIKHPDLVNKKIDEDPWRTYFDYRKGAVVAAIGDVPTGILKGKHANHQQQSADEQGVWALVTVFPSYSPGWVDLSKDERSHANSVWNAIRTSLWLSTERPFEKYITPDQVRKATVQERNLLKFLFKQHLPTAVDHVASNLPHSTNDKEIKDEDNNTLSDLHAVNHIWMKELQSIQEDEGQYWKMARCNPCVTFSMPEDVALNLQDNLNMSRWKIGLIGDHNGEVEMVVNSNNIKFPPFYPKSRRHLSVMLRDQEGLDEESKSKSIENQDYPTKIYPGAPAGWAYSHDDFSLGSLHVAEPYRRLKDTKSNKVKSQGVGSICLALISKMLVHTQKDTLRFAGCEDYNNLPTPVLSDAEQHKEIAVAFHRNAGFVPQTITSWGAYTIKTKKDVCVQ